MYTFTALYPRIDFSANQDKILKAHDAKTPHKPKNKIAKLKTKALNL